jgi:hypothetical protein
MCGKHDTTKHSELFQIGMQFHKALSIRLGEIAARRLHRRYLR